MYRPSPAQLDAALMAEPTRYVVEPPDVSQKV